ncbi:MAG: AgmX/PglI C-terminal domain-containing protein [Myxococcales bacterium]|nr:AgmX/PglI C-terminal domain-containing protein [Myxococcales bacterium]MDD9967715.1 AgmX/PglI C-terminal domain-containing protein [Myxococcales bacterium]
MSEAHRPPGGNTKYIVAGVVLLAGAAGLFWMLTSSPEPPPEPPPAPAKKKKEVERVNPLAQQNLIIEEEEEEPDAAEPEAQPEEPVKRKVRRVKRDTWDCEGDLDRGGLRKVMNSARPQVRTCYERRLKVNTILQGDVKLTVKVGAGGEVTATRIGGSLRDNEVFSCVRRLAKNWKFPKPTGGNCAVVNIPFQFSPKR